MSTSTRPLRILGLDPGLERVGFGVVDKTDNHWQAVTWGLIHTHKDNAMADRLVELYNDATELVKQVKPDVVCIEKLFYFKNQTTIIPVAQARGVLVLICGQHNLPYQEYTPMQVKLQVTGYGKADKATVQEMIKTLLKLDAIPKPDDTADALALALCYQSVGV
jgi:crossover junction endodeoxyribonuclease RuvC